MSLSVDLSQPMPDDGHCMGQGTDPIAAAMQPSSLDASKSSAYPPASDIPTQNAPFGIRFDFNLGARIVLPNRTEGTWRGRLRDLDSGNILFESENQGAFVNSAKRWFIRFRIEVWNQADVVPVFT